MAQQQLFDYDSGLDSDEEDLEWDNMDLELYEYDSGYESDDENVWDYLLLPEDLLDDIPHFIPPIPLGLPYFDPNDYSDWGEDSD